MPQRTLRFLIRQDGRVEESVEGVLGDSCHQLTENIEASLGKVEHRKSKAEAYPRPQDQYHSNSLEVSDVSFQHNQNYTS